MLKKMFYIFAVVLFSINLYSDYLIQQSENELSDFNLLLGQTISTLDEGIITEIVVYSCGTTNSTLRIFSGVSLDSGDEIYNQPVSFTGNGSRHIVLDSPVEVNENSSYTFVIDHTSIKFAESTSYSGGSIIYGGTMYTGYDLFFEVYIADAATAPPPLPVIDDLSIQIEAGNTLLNWTYSVYFDSFHIYKSIDPHDFTSAEVVVSLTNSYSEPVSETKYFYRVTAVTN
jgi:hypothetical protein